MMMVDMDPNELSIHWDPCKDSDARHGGVWPSERTGTWKFMAARLLREPDGGNLPVPNGDDDIESFFHTLLWIAAGRTDHLGSPQTLSVFLFHYFEDSFSDDKGVPRGGLVKVDALCEKKFFIKQLQLVHEPFTFLLEVMQRSLAVRYNGPPNQEDYDKDTHLKRQVQGEDPLQVFLNPYGTGIDILRTPGWTTQKAFSVALAHPYWVFSSWPKAYAYNEM